MNIKLNGVITDFSIQNSLNLCEKHPIKAFNYIICLCNQASLALAQIFFSSNLNLGRSLFFAMMIAAPKTALFGTIGLFLTMFFAKILTKNHSLKSSGLIELNGWFLGISTATFYSNPQSGLVVLLCLSVICPLTIIALDRFLRVWDLPQLVLSYVLCIWMVQLLAPYNTFLNFTVDASPQILDQKQWQLILTSAIKGYGQIFFQDNGFFSLLVFVILARFKILPIWFMIIAPIFATTLAYFIVGNHWTVTSGLVSFNSILLGAAFHQQFVKPTKEQLLILVAFSGIAELVAIQLAGLIHIFALSMSYIGIIWASKLVTEAQTIEEKEVSPSMPW